MKDRLIIFLEAHLDLARGVLQRETRFEDVVEDSLSFLEMILHVREKFGPLSNAQLAKIYTVGNLIDHYEAAAAAK